MNADDLDVFDVLVVGSGFGGSVSALRLTEKGYRVGVLEAGRRYTRDTLPRTSLKLRDYLWAPRLGLYGIQRVHLMKNVMVLAGAGVGGGSLNYANTLYVPPPAFFRDRQWADITDWRTELAPYYDQARRMLGVRTNPTTTEADELLRDAAGRMGAGDTFRLTPVGVFFGDGKDADGSATAPPGAEVRDPYFGGAGPARAACTECGSCMTGCRVGAKNILTENYLHLAERAGAEVRPLTTVTSVRERDDGTYEVTTVPTNRPRRGRRTVLRARRVVLAAGTYGTQTLLHRMKADGTLPRLSDRLGVLTRTNSEALVGALTWPRRLGRRDVDFTRGVAITSSVHPNENTHIENVRYGKGSNLMALICVPQYRQNLPKPLAAALAFLSHPVLVARTVALRHWSERTIIGLVMQTHDNSLTTGLTRRGALTAEQGHGRPNPVHIPEGWQAAGLIAESINGFAGTNLGELLGKPLTAHFLGGCVIGDSERSGVIDPYHRLYGHPGISVVDGSAVSANLGVNPSLTITAQAERAMAYWPNRGESDPRPEQGAPYRELRPVTPKAPAVPAGAHGELRF
ncbi:GMC family oxidoreductase N-terminal domain-containing protein [Streptomyces longispororuber]|uniref:GMC family oxidoreductase N-terminal domain-containing protein n=1 Tax=Streptomyces longispororuber TaxID=68230 RepID=UPI0021088113|nr:GMC family oxidoreductase [Streptomyces longispororuber]MCQ4210595.1 GMC family oxidoreductase [Streptomyces longispororuber]